MDALSLAIVGEGTTDQVVLENILLGFFKGKLDSGYIAFEQPQRDETGSHQTKSWGNWLNVLKYLEEKRYRDVFQIHPYVVVQIDCDTCEQKGFDVKKSDRKGKTLEDLQLVAAVRARLEQAIGREDLNEFSGQFLFAICVNEMECWLLPLHCLRQHVKKVVGCKSHVDAGLVRANREMLKKDKVSTYSSASAEFRKKKLLLGAAEKQQSLKAFLDELTAVPVA